MVEGTVEDNAHTFERSGRGAQNTKNRTWTWFQNMFEDQKEAQIGIGTHYRGEG